MSLWRKVVGRPLRQEEAEGERIGTIAALPALSLDALTSVAYGPEAIVLVLATAGLGALHFMLPITIAIVVLLSILVVSYRQVIDGYPLGGGAYAVSKANLGPQVALVAAASLVVDYLLTVAVSIAAGVAAITSAFPVLIPATLPMALAMLVVITIMNLRGLGESARAFLLPTAVFIGGLLLIIAIGLIHPLAPHISQPGKSLLGSSTKAVGLLLLLKAFSSGCSALTGVEAIANGVPLFREPRQIRAKRAEAVLGILLGVMLVGLAILDSRLGLGPRSSDTVLSQIMAASVGRSWLYYAVSLSITAVLGLAANTSFGSLPVLASLLARDNYLPHAFAIRGDRLVYTEGIWTLTAAAAALLIASNANTNALIPLFAIGVFTGFTLAQAGMVLHWRAQRGPGWRRRAVINGVGSTLTALATLVFLISKFTGGAWVVLVAVPILVASFKAIHRYYDRLGKALRLGELPEVPTRHSTIVLVPITGISELTANALSDAISLGCEVLAFNVAFPEDAERAKELERNWARWAPGIRLSVLRTEYHSLVRPIIRFVRAAKADHDRVMVLIPVMAPIPLRYKALHNQLDVVLSTALAKEPDVVIARSHFSLPSPQGSSHAVPEHD